MYLLISVSRGGKLFRNKIMVISPWSYERRLSVITEKISRKISLVFDLKRGRDYKLIKATYEHAGKYLKTFH